MQQVFKLERFSDGQLLKRTKSQRQFIVLAATYHQLRIL
jgi:hypothetical protein